MPTNSATAVTCPDSEKALFEGSFPAFLRELVKGSSRKDLLSAIYVAKGADWEVSKATGAVTLATGTVHAVFFPKAPDAAPWVQAETPHGEFSLQRGHWMVKGIQLRAERRLAADGLALAQQGPKCVEELLQTAQAAAPRVWVAERPQRLLFHSTLLSISRDGFSTQLSNGFTATITNERSGGEIPLSVACDDAMRFQMELEAHQRRERESSGAGIPWGGGGSYSPLPPLRPPISPGPWSCETTEIAIRHDRLNELRTAFGMDPLALHADTADVLDGAWNPKARQFKGIFMSASKAAQQKA